MSKRYKVVLGRGELVTFPDLGIFDIPAKVDTGAYRSAVHAQDIQLSSDGKKLSFKLLAGHPVFDKVAQTITTDLFKVVEVENSFSHREIRYEVKFKITIGSKSFITGFTLANRKKKDFPILLGRKTLNQRFMVDTSVTNVDRISLKAQYREAVGIDSVELK